MMRQIVSAACGVLLAVTGAARAEPVLVVELFSSQGCSSCPPADEFLTMLAADPRVLPLSLHVDYWDYIGWVDTLAQPKFSDRQRAYALDIGSRTVYTPQLIIGGTDRVEGYAPDETIALLREHLAASPAVTVTVTREGDKLMIRAEADPPLTEPVRVQLVRYEPQVTVTIERGENAGRTMTYTNVVTSWDRLEDWTGQAPLELTAPYTGEEQGVVIIQDDGPSAILAAARVD